MDMPPQLAQVLNTLAHEIRTPLSVSQGYLKLYLDGRLTNADDTRRALEQTREALGALAALCVDMGKVSALAESASGIPERLSTAALIRSLRTQAAVKDASWSGEGGARSVDTTNHRDLVQALAIVSRAAFDEARDETPAVRADEGDELIVLAGTAASLSALQSGPQAPEARPVDFGRGGRGLKLIWAAFVLDKHRIQTWTHADHRAAVGFRIPLVSA